MQFGLEHKATMLNILLFEHLFLEMLNKSITKLYINMDKKQKRNWNEQFRLTQPHLIDKIHEFKEVLIAHQLIFYRSRL